jgi:pimeloyl-ACP methyl ester carboxylesterase
MQQDLVFIHGSGDNEQIWRSQVAYFQQHAHTLNLPGHGQQPLTLPSSPSVVDYANDVYTRIRTQLQLTKPVIIGHSLGGAIALQIGLDYGPQLGGLVLIGTGARLRVLPELLEEARNQPAEAKRQLVEMGLTPSNFASMGAALLQQTDSASLRSLSRDLNACNAFDVMSRLSTLDLPVLVICGEEDRLTTTKYSSYLQRQIRHAQICLIPQAGHYVMLEQPDSTNQAIERWWSNL